MRLVAALLALVAVAMPARAELLDFDDREIARILRHGPWPMGWAPDPSNRVSGQADAATLGRRLFFDPGFSADGKVACATCHDPARAWTDGKARSIGLATMDRNAPSLLDVRLQRWFGWDGGSDSLWSHSLRPMLDAREMGASPASIAGRLRTDSDLLALYRAAFDRAPPADDTAVLVDAGKALAAFQETLTGGRSAFDDFRDALAAGRGAAAGYPLAAQRGLRIFVGKGDCVLCHIGPAFTNGEFDDVGVGYFLERGRVDPGRHGGIERVQASRFNRLGPWSDAPDGDHALHTRHVAQDHRTFGMFKVPSLRNVGATAPYMHDGRIPTLREAVLHYSELNEDRVHADGGRALKALRLTGAEIDDLLAFLESLTGGPP